MEMVNYEKERAEIIKYMDYLPEDEALRKKYFDDHIKSLIDM